MTGDRPAGRRPMRRRSRLRWMVTGGVAACWLVLELATGSVVSATVVLMVVAVLAAAGVGGLRALGITRDHPWIQRLAFSCQANGITLLPTGRPRRLSDYGPPFDVSDANPLG